MGKTPGKWIKTLLLGKKSPKSNSANGTKILRTAKNEELVVSVKDDVTNLSIGPPVVSPQPVSVTPISGDDSTANLESRNDLENLELQRAVIKVQAAFRAHQARRASRTLKGIIKLQAVIRGCLVRRQAVATYSCIWGIVKFQALVRGQKARSSDNGIRFGKTLMEAGGSEVLKLSMYSWMDNPSKFVIVDKLLVSSPTVLPLKIQYGPEEPNSAKVWLERWSHLHVWSPGSREAKILVPKPKSKKRNYQAVVETKKVRPKQGVKKQNGPNSGNGSNRSSTDIEKTKRNVRKASTVSKDLRTESDKAKHHSRKSRSSTKEGSPLEIKDEKPRLNLKRSSLSNGSEKTNRKSAEKKKDAAASLQLEPELVKVSDVLEGGDAVEPAEKEKNTADSVQIALEVKVSDVLELGDDTVESAEKGENAENSVQIDPEVKVSDVLGEGHAVEFAEKEKDATDVVPKESDVEKEENLQEEDEPGTAETKGKGENLKCSDVKVSSENGKNGFDTTNTSERRASLRNIDNKDDGYTHSGRKIPSYMAPTASAKARAKGEGLGSPRFSQEKTEKNGTLRRHSLPSPANGKLSTTSMSPRAHKLLLASAKGSMNGDKSFSSSKNISDKLNRTEWKR